MAVVAQRLNKARNSLSPETGGSVYRFSEQAIQDLPQGSNTSLNQVLLQAPGVVQDSFGQLHVRGDHANLQYRINGVQLPEGITGFGQVLSPRFAQSISLLTGALPAEFGLRTAGVIDIKTKDGLLENGGDVEFYGGQRSTIQPSFEYGGSNRQVQLFRDRPVPQHHPRCRAADSGAITDSRSVLPGPGVRLFFVFSEPHHTAQPGNGFGR